MIIASFFSDLGSFFSSLGDVHLTPLLLGAVLFVAYLSMRALAFRNILQDAYPGTPVPFKQIWGAYLAAYGFNNVIPARGGDVLKVYLVKTSIPGSTYPTIGAALLVEAIFDLCAGALAVTVALIAGVFPKPPSWVSLNSVDLSFVAEDGKRSLFLVTALAVLVLVVFSLVALRVRTFWAKVRQGFAVLRDRRRYLKRVWAMQGIGWLIRGTAFFFLLKAFSMPASVENVLFVLSANAVAAIFPFTPGGAGVVQALLVELLKGTATTAAIAAYGVGQQAVIALLSLAVGFVALVFVFNIRSFREVIERGRADREASRAAERAEKEGRAARDISGEEDTATVGPNGPGIVGDHERRAGGPAPNATDDWLDDVAASGPVGSVSRATPPAARPPATAAVDDWLAEEVAPDRAREERREARAKWRRRQRR